MANCSQTLHVEIKGKVSHLPSSSNLEDRLIRGSLLVSGGKGINGVEIADNTVINSAFIRIRKGNSVVIEIPLRLMLIGVNSFREYYKIDVRGIDFKESEIVIYDETIATASKGKYFVFVFYY